MANYWQDREAAALAKLTTKSVAETEAQLIKYYRSASEKIIGQFTKTYNKVLSSINEGKEPTPADLYKLDTYWKMQGQLKEELQALGDKQAELLSKRFVEQYKDVYEGLAIKDGMFFNQIDTEAAEQMINQIWCADGKNWSSRIWTNTSKLQQSLNDNLLECLITGKKTTELKNLLQAEFKVGYSRANTLVKTEMAHIQTVAAQQRYKDTGVDEVQIWADYDERRCDICGKLHKTKYKVNEPLPIPAHPNCRCCIIPVVSKRVEPKVFSCTCEDCGQTFESYNESFTVCPTCKNERWKQYHRVDEKKKLKKS